ncbi:MAG: cation diffusion facilitator family transporter, partial [Thermoguttaceae bacterium]
MANSATTRDESAREKLGVAVASLLAAILLTVLKLVVGLITNSLGILAEAAHSGLDLLAAGVTLWAIRMSARPADRKQTYGYGKFENLSALFETLLLLVTCIWIVYEASRRFFFHEKIEVDPSVWAFLVVILSIVVDFSRSRDLLRVSRKFHSQALEADALHFSTDIWSSCVVLFGLSGVLAAQHFKLPWLANAD